MKSFLLTFFLSLGLLYGASTTSKIEDSKKNLSKTSSDKKKTSRRLSKLAKDIKSAEKDIVYLERKIDALGKDQTKREAQYHSLKKELDMFDKEFKSISADLDRKRETFISLLSDQFSIIFAMEQSSHEPTRKSILSQEVYRAYKKYNFKVLASLKTEILELKKSKKKKLYLRNKARTEIDKIIKKA